MKKNSTLLFFFLVQYTTFITILIKQTFVILLTYLNGTKLHDL